MLADTKRRLSTSLGILHRGEGVPLRATFLVDPQSVIRWVSVNDLSVGRNVDEVLLVLDASLQLARGRAHAPGGVTPPSTI